MEIGAVSGVSGFGALNGLSSISRGGDVGEVNAVQRRTPEEESTQALASRFEAPEPSRRPKEAGLGNLIDMYA